VYLPRALGNSLDLAYRFPCHPWTLVDGTAYSGNASADAKIKPQDWEGLFKQLGAIVCVFVCVYVCVCGCVVCWCASFVLCVMWCVCAAFLCAVFVPFVFVQCVQVGVPSMQGCVPKDQTVVQL
jgi:hypothetical protein